MANRKVQTNGIGNVLSLEDITSSTAERYKTVEIPEIQKEGKPGVLMLKIPSAGVVLGFSDKGDTDKKEYLLQLMVDVVVSPTGDALFNDVDQVRNLPVDVFTRLSGAVTEMINVATSSLGDAKGKESPAGDDSPTN